jgi:1,2-phenylacetyl-CoA epoxidase PaaB subunit
VSRANTPHKEATNLPRYDVGISDEQHDPPRRLDITVAASDPREAMAAAEDRWRHTYSDEPPSALRGMSWGY